MIRRPPRSTLFPYTTALPIYAGSYIDLSRSANPFGQAAFTDVSDFVFSDVDWLGGLFGNAWNMEHNLGVSGGSDKHNYRVSLAYNYDGSNLQFGNNKNQRYTFRVSDT